VLSEGIMSHHSNNLNLIRRTGDEILRTHDFYIIIVEHPCCVMSDYLHANTLVCGWFGGSTDPLAQGYVLKRCLLAS